MSNLIDFSDFDIIISEWEQAKNNAAKLNREAAILEKCRDAFLEKLAFQVRDEEKSRGKHWDGTKLKALTKADQRYEDYIVEMCEKREEAESAYIHADALKMKFEAMRSANATQREAMRMT